MSKLNGYDISDDDWIQQVINHAKFIKQDPKIWMFVPCDEKGNVLEEPKYLGGCNEILNSFNMDRWKQAKERVLFEGFYIERGVSRFNKDRKYLTHADVGSIAYKKEEEDEWTFMDDLVYIAQQKSVVLTETAKKQIQ